MSSAETSITHDPAADQVGEHPVDAEAVPLSVPYSGPARSGAMTRIDCARPLCAEAATARFMIDAVHKLVIVDSKVDEWGASGSVCTRHADRLKAPNGWMLEDRREGHDETGLADSAQSEAEKSAKLSRPTRPSDAGRLGSSGRTENPGRTGGSRGLPKPAEIRPGATPVAAANSPLLTRAFASLANVDQGSGLASLFPAASPRRSVS